MRTALALGISLAAVLGLGLSAAWAAAGRAVSRVHLGVAGAVEAAIVVQAGLAAVELVGGHRPGSLATFLGYLVTVLLVLPFAGAIALEERTRWGSVSLAVGFLTVAVLMLRLTATW